MAEKEIRVFPRRTKWTPNDDLVFIGHPPFFYPTKDIPVRISCTFTWDIEESERLARSWGRFYSDVEVGGPAYDDPGGEFEPGRFVKNGIIHTSRGCIKDCDWCLVPQREGWIRELPIKAGWNVNDNNLLACSKQHIEKVFSMLREQKRPVVFSGGLDAELFQPEHAELLRSLRLREAWFACDYPGAMQNLERIAGLLSDIRPRKKRCYVLIGFNGEKLRQAEKRLRAVWNLGFWPFAMLYRPRDTLQRNNWTQDWLNLQRTWCRPAAFNTKMASQ